MKTGNDFGQGKRKGGIAVRIGLGMAVVLGISFAVFSMLYIRLYLQQIHSGYRVAELYKQYEKLLSVQRKLKLEWVRFDDPYRLEDVGRKQFGLAPPTPEQKVMLVK